MHAGGATFMDEDDLDVVDNLLPDGSPTKHTSLGKAISLPGKVLCPCHEAVYDIVLSKFMCYLYMRGFQPFLWTRCGLLSLQSLANFPQSLANFAEIKVSLSDRPWVSSYIMQCVRWLWTLFWPSSDYFPGELKWRWARYNILQVWSARNSNTAWWFRTNC
jgi:hypothetical protein